MSIPTPTQEWKAKANAEYQKVMSAVITLSTATLVLPTLFLKDFLGVAGGTPLLPRLTPAVYAAWFLLFVAIASALGFYFASAKWLKQAYGGPVGVSEQAIEWSLNRNSPTSTVIAPGFAARQHLI